MYPLKGSDYNETYIRILIVISLYEIQINGSLQHYVLLINEQTSFIQYKY